LEKVKHQDHIKRTAEAATLSVDLSDNQQTLLNQSQRKTEGNGSSESLPNTRFHPQISPSERCGFGIERDNKSQAIYCFVHRGHHLMIKPNNDRIRNI